MCNAVIKASPSLDLALQHRSRRSFMSPQAHVEQLEGGISLKSYRLYAAAALMPLAIASATPAFAQAATASPDPTQVPEDAVNPESPNADEGEAPAGQIVVTGSRIRRDGASA